MTEEVEIKQRKDIKPGRVVRINPTLERYIEKHRHRETESISTILCRRLDLPPRRKTKSEFITYWIINKPFSIYKTLAEARGAAVLAAVRSGKPKNVEKPQPVKYDMGALND